MAVDFFAVDFAAVDLDFDDDFEDDFEDDFDALAEDFDLDEDFALDFDALADFEDFDFEALDVLPRDGRAEPRPLFFFERDDVERERLCGRSTRSETGSARTPFGSSSTATSAASARSARTSEMTLAGWRAREAWTRFVSSTTNMSRSGSIQIEVPV